MNETTVGVINKMGVIGLGNHTGSHFIVQAEIKNRIHHTGHRRTGTGTNRNKQGIGRITELTVHQLLDMRYSRRNLVFQQAHDFFLTHLIIFIANFGCNRKARRDRDSNQIHFGKVCTLTAQQLPHVGLAFSLAATESVHSFIFHKQYIIDFRYVSCKDKRLFLIYAKDTKRNRKKEADIFKIMHENLFLMLERLRQITKCTACNPFMNVPFCYST